MVFERYLSFFFEKRGFAKTAPWDESTFKSEIAENNLIFKVFCSLRFDGAMLLMEHDEIVRFVFFPVSVGLSKEVLLMELRLGTKASLSKTVTDRDVRMFAEVSLDYNPIHLDEEAAKKSIFGRRIAHGDISLGLISAVLGNYMPGRGTIYLGQEIKFVSPVFIDDTITAEAEIVEVIPEKNRYKIRTDVKNQAGVLVATGFALVKYLPA